MKKELFTALLLMGIFTACLINISYIGKLTGEINELISQSMELADRGEWKAAAKSAETAVNLWHAHDAYTHIVIKHADIDSATDALHDLLAEIYSESCGNVNGTALKARYHFECIYNMEKISFGSVF